MEKIGIANWCKLFPVGHNYKAMIAMKIDKTN